MGVPRPGGNGKRQSKLLEGDYHAIQIKLPKAEYRRYRKKTEEMGSTPSSHARNLISGFLDPPRGPDHVFVNNEAGAGERELIIVARDGISVRAPVVEGRVQANCVRVHDDREDKEIVYWSMDEWQEGNDREDPSTAMNAILSAIQMVAFGTYREVMERRRKEMLEKSP